MAAGQLPSEVNGHPVTYSVRSHSKGTSAVDVTVHGIRDVDQTEPQPEGHYSRQYKKPLKETTRRLLALSSAYDRSNSDVMTDYHHGRYWSDVTVESGSSAAFWAKDKATSKIKAEYQKARRSGADVATLAEIAGRYKVANTKPSEDYNPFRSGS